MHDATTSAGLSEGGPAVVYPAVTGRWMTPDGAAAWGQQPAVRTRKVAILGFGATVKDCPWQDPTWELWGLNGFWRVAKPEHGIDVPEERYTLWFDMHSLDYTRDYGKRAGIGDQQESWLREPHPFTIFALDTNPDHPSVQAYPIDAMIQVFNRDYFTSGVAYALAFALAQPDVAEIGLYGIDLIHDTEYEQQRPCAEYWIGRAEERGIKVTVHEQSALLKQRYRYGYNQENPLGRELRAGIMQQVADLRAAIAKNRAEGERLFAQANTDDGACQALVSVLNRLEHWDRGGRVA